MQATTHYAHSGIAPAGGVFMTLIGGIAVGAACSALYALLIHWIPFVYINVFITFGFAMAVAVSVGLLAKKGKFAIYRLWMRSASLPQGSPTMSTGWSGLAGDR